MTSLSVAVAGSIIVSNVDMLSLILLRLPIKSLLVFKSVSKQWFSLISDPFFINKYILQNSPLPIQGLYIQDSLSGIQELDYIPVDGSSSSAPFRTLDFIDDPYGLKIMQSCNGLMLCKGSTCTSDDKECSTYYIYNPSTIQYRQIVCQCKIHENGFDELASVGLAYDPLKSPYYKVVCIWSVSKSWDFKYQIEIYSSETASWKLSGEVFSRHGAGGLYFSNPVYWNGSLHSIAKANSFCFNVDRELRMEIPSYYSKENDVTVHYFGECKGRLYLIVSPHSYYYPTSLKIFEMKTDYTGWNRRYLVDLRELIRAYPDPNIDVNVLFVNEEGESPNFILQLPPRDEIFCYNLKDGSFQEIQELAQQLAPAGRDRQHVGYQYIQTLACI